jgi:hypothetical protein
MSFGEVRWGNVDWIGLDQDRDRRRALVNALMNLRIAKNAEKLSCGLTTDGLSSSVQLYGVSHFSLCICRTSIVLCELWGYEVCGPICVHRRFGSHTATRTSADE